MSELLLELFSEEIPARMQATAMNDLKRLVCDGLKKVGLEFGEVTTHVTPRRMVLMINGLPAATPDIKDERKGPKVGSPEQALAGFMKGNGLTSIEEAEIRDLPKGQFYFAIIDKIGRPSASVLSEVLPAALQAMPWPKSMRWSNHAL